jgi:hypothetical protein
MYCLVTLNGPRRMVKTFPTQRGAKIACTRLHNKIGGEVYAVMSVKEFNKTDRKVKVQNLLTGKPVEINESERGGVCDPSTERYWSM